MRCDAQEKIGRQLGELLVLTRIVRMIVKHDALPERAGAQNSLSPIKAKGGAMMPTGYALYVRKAT
jgi:hypothetical protein